MGITARQLDEWKRSLIGEYNDVVNSIHDMSNKSVVNLDTLKYLMNCKKSLESQINNYDTDDFFYGV